MNLAVRRASRWSSVAAVSAGHLTACIVALAPATASAAEDPADGIVSVTPYRPSVSTPAALSAPGWLEVEAGVQRSRAQIDPQRRDSLNYTLKLAFTPDWGIRLGGDAWVRERDQDGSTRRGGGDTDVVLKRRFQVDDAQAFGLELGATLPTAGRALGSGKTDVVANGIYSADFGRGWHADINLTATRIGDVAADEGRVQRGYAVAVSRSLGERFGVVAELSGTAQRGADRTAQALLAGSLTVGPALVLDLGVSKGLNRASGGWSVFSGVTFLAARLF